VTVVMRDLVDECVTVAQADGVMIPGDVDVAVRKIAETAAGQYASTAQYLARQAQRDRSSERVDRAAWRSAGRRDARQPAAACDRQADREQVAGSSLPLETIV
jgi:hypothetical protein